MATYYLYLYLYLFFYLMLRIKATLPLFINHLDAWVVALISAGLALMIHDGVSAATLYLLSAITVGYWAAFALNDYCDAPYDAQDETKAARSFFVRHTVSRPQLITLFCLLTAFITPAFLQFGWRGLLLLFVCVFIAWAYSAPPLRLKNRPVIDLITHATFVETFPYLIVLLLLRVHWLPIDFAILSCAALASLSAQLENQISDYEIDRRNERNFTTKFGLPTTIYLFRLTTLVLIVIAAGCALTGIIPRLYVPLGLLCLPILGHRLWHNPPRPRPHRMSVLLACSGVLYLVVLVLFSQ